MGCLLLQEFYSIEQIFIPYIDGGNSHLPVNAADQSGYGKGLFRFHHFSAIKKKVSRINDQNRPSVGSYFFYKCCPPGKTAQFFVASNRTGKDVPA